ncbi:SAM-dependent methyltransferase, partial [bacterium I07]
LERGNPDVEKIFGRHVHWGYWEHSADANHSNGDFMSASERLCRMICDKAGIRSGMRILDVGCGFWGTIASLNERFESLELTMNVN